MKINELFCALYEGRTVFLSNYMYNQHIPFLVVAYETEYVLECIDINEVIYQDEIGSWEFVDFIPDHLTSHKCGNCHTIDLIDKDNTEYSCILCVNNTKTLKSYEIADSVYRYHSNNDLKIITGILNGICTNNDESIMNTSERGIITNHNHMCDFDDYSCNYFTIVDNV